MLQLALGFSREFYGMLMIELCLLLLGLLHRTWLSPRFQLFPFGVTLKNIPNQLYSFPEISHIASRLGAPMTKNKLRLYPTLMDEAKILVDVELRKDFPPKITSTNEMGFIPMVDIEYTLVPSKCGHCGQLGHKVSRCLQQFPFPHKYPQRTKSSFNSTKEAEQPNITLIMHQNKEADQEWYMSLSQI